MIQGIISGWASKENTSKYFLLKANNQTHKYMIISDSKVVESFEPDNLEEACKKCRELVKSEIADAVRIRQTSTYCTPDSTIVVVTEVDKQIDKYL